MAGLPRFWTWRSFRFFWLACFVAALAVVAGCGQDGGVLEVSSAGPTGGPTTASSAVSTTVSSAVSEDPAQGTSSTAEPATESSGFLPAFEYVAREMAPGAVYGLRALPEGAVLAAEWWPVVEVESPQEYSGQQQPNPWVYGGRGEAASAEIVFRWGDGWVDVLENIRGDLGETPGEFVGDQGDAGASRYEVNGGIAIVWSRDGRWYGVFGRQVEVEALTELALRMEIVPVR